METIRIIGTSICITLVATSIFSMLVPNSKLDKVLRFAIGIFFLTSLITPFTNADLRFDFDLSLDEIHAQSKLDALNNQADLAFSTLASRNLENSLSRMLMQNEVNVQKISTTINKSSDGNISITKLSVQIDDCENPLITRTVNDLILREVGLLPEITYEGIQ